MESNDSDAGERSAVVVVLGDIGRSPRMQYHAISLANEGYDHVYMIGYLETEPKSALLDSGRVQIVPLQPASISAKVLPSILTYIFKTIILFLSLCRTALTIRTRPKLIICQNPPSMPTLPFCWLYALVTRATFVIDWHNYSWSVMALRYNRRRTVIVRLLDCLEAFFGRRADASFCVTKALRDDLKAQRAIDARVLYDTPPENFRYVCDDAQRHTLFRKLAKDYPAFRSEGNDPDSTAFSKLESGGYPVLLANRPALVVSSSSWTEDDDVDVLLDALCQYDEAALDSDPRILCVLTGKGPTRALYEAKVESMELSKVDICFVWLAPEDYPKLLGSADVGVCLHNSSSGLDLPMKVIDMFGCRLPVLALYYECLADELVVDTENGFVFRSAGELSNQLHRCIADFQRNGEAGEKGEASLLDRMRDNLAQRYGDAGEGKYRWHQQWKSVALPHLTAVAAS